MKVMFPFVIALIAMFALSSCGQKQAQLEIEEGGKYIVFLRGVDTGIKGEVYSVKGGFKILHDSLGKKRETIIPFHAVIMVKVGHE